VAKGAIQERGTRGVNNSAGASSSGQVNLAVHKETGQHVAIKDIVQERLTAKLQENLESEISILKNHVHQHIVKLYAIEVSGED
jgi:serine/threonine protein kinase